LDGGAGDLAKVENQSHDGLVVVGGARLVGVVAGGELAVGEEGGEEGLIGAEGGGGLGGGGGEIGIAPVDAMVVAGGAEDGLGDGADAESGEGAGFIAGPGDLFICSIDSDLGAGAVVDGDGVFFPVHGADLPGKEAEGQGEGVEVVGQCGGEEGEGDVDVGVFKIANGAGGGDFEGDLREGGGVVGFGANEAEDAVVHAEEAEEGVLAAGPVLGGAIVQMVGGGPDAEERIEGDEGHGRGTEWLGGSGERAQESGGEKEEGPGVHIAGVEKSALSFGDLYTGKGEGEMKNAECGMQNEE